MQAEVQTSDKPQRGHDQQTEPGHARERGEPGAEAKRPKNKEKEAHDQNDYIEMGEAGKGKPCLVPWLEEFWVEARYASQEGLVTGRA